MVCLAVLWEFLRLEITLQCSVSSTRMLEQIASAHAYYAYPKPNSKQLDQVHTPEVTRSDMALALLTWHLQPWRLGTQGLQGHHALKARFLVLSGQ